MKTLKDLHTKFVFGSLLLLISHFALAQVDSLRMDTVAPLETDSITIDTTAEEGTTYTIEKPQLDTIKETHIIQGDHNPSKAALLSAVFPGMGQIYNKKYWKVPIVYAALGGAAYAIVFNHDQYKIYLNAFYSQIDGDASNDQFAGTYDQRQLIELQNIYRRWRDLSIILGAVAYGLNILDAYVDAHLFYYDVSEDLSMRWEPTVITNQYSMPSAIGLGITIHLK